VNLGKNTFFVKKEQLFIFPIGIGLSHWEHMDDCKHPKKYRVIDKTIGKLFTSTGPTTFPMTYVSGIFEPRCMKCGMYLLSRTYDELVVNNDSL